MSRHINVAAALPRNAEQLRWAVHKGFAGGISGARSSPRNEPSDGG